MSQLPRTRLGMREGCTDSGGRPPAPDSSTGHPRQRGCCAQGRCWSCWAASAPAPVWPRLGSTHAPHTVHAPCPTPAQGWQMRRAGPPGVGGLQAGPTHSRPPEQLPAGPEMRPPAVMQVVFVVWRHLHPLLAVTKHAKGNMLIQQGGNAGMEQNLAHLGAGSIQVTHGDTCSSG